MIVNGTGRYNKADREATQQKCETYLSVRRSVYARSDKFSYHEN